MYLVLIVILDISKNPFTVFCNIHLELELQKKKKKRQKCKFLKKSQGFLKIQIFYNFF